MSNQVAGTTLTTMQRRVMARLDNPFMTTQEQADTARHEGDAFVSACPGAGKTHTVGLRLAHHAAFHRDLSVAAVSHTNTAVGAIRAAAQSIATLPECYFVDTLHTFLLRYVVYPFGHLYMGCDTVPEVVGDEDRDWPDDLADLGAPGYPGLRVKSWRFDLGSDGALTYQRPTTWPATLTADVIVAECGDWALRQKVAYWQRSLLSYSDALWVALQILQEREPLAAAVAARFDELIVDEVQDTGQLQLACLAQLRARDRHPSLVIVGDLCQAVFEWSRATPEGLREFAHDQRLGELQLTANFRSSRRICAVTHHFSTRGEPDRARGPNAGADHIPALWTYVRKGEVELVKRFRDLLSELGVAESNAAVLAWRRSLVDRLNGRPGDGKRVGHWLLRLMGAAAVERDDKTGPNRETFQALDRALGYIAYRTSQMNALTYGQRASIRPASAELLRLLPRVDGDLRDWNLAARDLLAQAATELTGAQPANVNRYMTDATSLHGVDARQALEPPPSELSRTIHSAKGESITAVMVVASEQDAATWAAELWLDAPPDHTSEALRVAYVALTRAERLLILAVPRACEAWVGDRYRAVGFA